MNDLTLKFFQIPLLVSGIGQWNMVFCSLSFVVLPFGLPGFFRPKNLISKTNNLKIKNKIIKNTRCFY